MLVWSGLRHKLLSIGLLTSKDELGREYFCDLDGYMVQLDCGLVRTEGLAPHGQRKYGIARKEESGSEGRVLRRREAFVTEGRDSGG
jgi:hypothetical protein